MILLLLACSPSANSPRAFVLPAFATVDDSKAWPYPYQMFKPKDVLPRGPVCVETLVNQAAEPQKITRVWERWAPGVYGFGDLDFEVPADWRETPSCEVYTHAESWAYVQFIRTLNGEPSPYEAERQAAKARGRHWSQVVDDRLAEGGL